MRIIAAIFTFALLIPFMLPQAEVREGTRLASPEASLDLDARKNAYKSATLPGQGGLMMLISALDVLGDEVTTAEGHCLVQAIYFEARSEPVEGQLAVAQVVLNRTKNPRFPNTICGVVFQNEKLRNRCQFSFACDGLSDNPYNKEAWEIAQRISYIALSGRWEDITKSAMYYHANYVTPYWVKRLETTAQHGSHIFYRDAAS